MNAQTETQNELIRLVARVDQLEQACMLALQALQDPDFDEYFDANKLEKTLTDALMGVSHA
jgi:hypothetical protein